MVNLPGALDENMNCAADVNAYRILAMSARSGVLIVFSKFSASWVSFCLLILSLPEENESLSHVTAAPPLLGLSIFCSIYFELLLWSAYTFRIVFVLLVDCSSLPLFMIFVLKSTLSDVTIAGDASDKEPACQHRRPKRSGFNSWVGKIPWRRAQQPTPVFLPGESHGQRSLTGYSP